MRTAPPVVIYVTRENPQTALDELLVFDIDDEYRTIVPGGGIEEGETVEQAARREALEETGVEVRDLREVGKLPGSHFVQGWAAAPSPDEWDHVKTPGYELVHCRWVKLREDLELWGERGAFVAALIRRRAVVYATRDRNGSTELLTIEAVEYPEEGIQVPAGRIDHDEELEAGLWRELAEETGITRGRFVRELPDFQCLYETFSRNHAFHVVVDEDTPDVWEHRVNGTGADSGLTYICRWVPLTADLKLWRKEGDPMLRHLPIESG